MKEDCALLGCYPSLLEPCIAWEILQERGCAKPSLTRALVSCHIRITSLLDRYTLLLPFFDLLWLALPSTALCVWISPFLDGEGRKD